MADHINRLKTAMLFEASAVLGAIAAGSGRKETGAMAGYGASLGMLFQITDDIIDGDYDSDVKEKAKADHSAKISARQAKASLKIFGNRAARLIEIVDYVVDRIK